MADPSARNLLTILFVCTGNTCRSPMAEALLRERLSTALNCDPNSLPERGFRVISGGLAASPGSYAATNARLMMKGQRAGLETHESRQVTGELLEECDLVFAMTTDHLEVLRQSRPDLGDRFRLLRSDAVSVRDPIGGDLDEYRRCAEEIRTAVDQIAADILRESSEK